MFHPTFRRFGFPRVNCMSAAALSLSFETHHKNKWFAKEAGITIFYICLSFNKKGGESACVIKKVFHVYPLISNLTSSIALTFQQSKTLKLVKCLKRFRIGLSSLSRCCNERSKAESIGLDCKKFLLASLRNSTGFGREAVDMRHWSLEMRKPRVGQSRLVASTHCCSMFMALN